MLTGVKSREKIISHQPERSLDMNKEKWLPVRDYAGFYEVSDLGRVRSLDRTVHFRDNKGKRDYKGKILKQKYHNGYPVVNILKNKHCYTINVHRLVAETFIPEIEGKTWVNHKNGIKADNKVSNLEWVTARENNIHARETGLHKEDNVAGLIKYSDTLKKKVVAIRNNKIIAIEECSRDMATRLMEEGILTNASLTTVGRSIRKSASEGNLYKGIMFQYI